MNLLRLVAICVAAMACAPLTHAQRHDRVQPVPAAFFGLVIHRPLGAAWPQVPFATWRMWDGYLNWLNVEPRPGQFKFDVFDKQVDRGTSDGKQLIYTLGQTPTWASSSPGEKHAWGYGAGAMPKNHDDWKQYVSAVVSRYKGRIAGYEVWNEPKFADLLGRCKGAVFFCGSAADLVTLTRSAHEIIKGIDPAAVLASPGFTGAIPGLPLLDEYLAAGAAPYLDAISYHFYDLEPEAAWKTIDELRKILHAHKLDRLPIWNSEVGFLVQNQAGSVTPQQPWGVFSVVFSPEAAAGRLARVHLVAASGGLDRVYWYAWDDNKMGTFELPDGQATALGTAYAAVQRWLVGSTVSCGPGKAGADWGCELKRGGRTATVLWDRDLHSPRQLRLPAVGKQFIEPLLEAGQAADAGKTLDWNGLPVLFTGDGKPWTTP
jgi:hypothetical protein